MADSSTPKHEIPAEMRAMAERSVEQAKSTFDKCMQGAHEALSALDQWFKASQAGAHDIGTKAMTFAQRNVQSAFEFAQNIAQAQNVEEVVKRADHVRSVANPRPRRTGEGTRRDRREAYDGGREPD